jgi:hypothetical protein
MFEVLYCFCVLLYFTGFGRKSIKFQNYDEVGKLSFGKIQLQINFEFKEKEVGKNSLFLERIQNEHVSII